MEKSQQGAIPKPLRLKFQDGNAKLGRNIKTFSLLAGTCCPGAHLCKATVKVREGTGKLYVEDGKHSEYRCFMATSELRGSTYKAHLHNWELLKARKKNQAAMEHLLRASMPQPVDKMRVHASGDFFNQGYFDAWLVIAREFSRTLFYAYTKSLPYWVKRINEIPDNLVLTASNGGKWDHLIEEYQLRNSVVISHPEEAIALGIPWNHDDGDSNAYTREVTSFALLLHGTQPADSEAAAALTRLKRENIKYSYGRK